MQLSGIPSKFNIPFAASAGGGYIRAIPQASQIGITNGAASLTDGFPPLTFLPVGAGGVPPFGQDFNGLLNQTTAWTRWQNAGGNVPYDATFATAIGGYPQGAVILAASGVNLWLNTVDNNTTNPDAGGANWIPILSVIQSNTTFYVNNSTGSDSNNGLTTGTAWATLAHAISALSGLNLNGFTITIQLANTGVAYPSPGIFAAPSTGTLIIQGNTASQSSYIISGAGVGSGTGVIGVSSGNLFLQGLTLQNTGTTNHLLLALSGGQINCQNITFTTSVTGTLALAFASQGGGITFRSGNIFSGSAGYMWLASGGYLTMGANQVTASSPTYSIATVSAQDCGTIILSTNTWTWSGSGATGSRYLASKNGVIDTVGSGSTFFPGNSAGTNPTGGQYI